MIPGPWQAFQTQIEGIIAEKGAGAAVDFLIDYHCKNQLLSASDLEQIQASLSATSDFPQILYSPWRAMRGISARPHPRPRHVIGYKNGTPCFCCLPVIRHQWPSERGFSLPFKEKTLCFLPNISPLFPRHLTIVSVRHTPQAVDIALMGRVARFLAPDWVIVNDEGAGASNPWHFHLQSFSADLPLSRIDGHRLSPMVTQLDTTMPIFKFELTPRMTGKLGRCLYEAKRQLPELRTNVFSRFIDNRHFVLIALRQSSRKTTLYASGQPGCAEAAAVITTTSLEQFKKWENQGKTLFKQLIEEISPLPVYSKTFVRLLKTFEFV